MTECIFLLPYNFYQQRQLVVRYSDLELSSDAGILLARQAEEQEPICRGLADCIANCAYLSFLKPIFTGTLSSNI